MARTTPAEMRRRQQPRARAAEHAAARTQRALGGCVEVLPRRQFVT